MTAPARSCAATALGLLVLLALWEAAGQGGWVAGGALPAPSAVLVRLWQERDDYLAHAGSTAAAAALGFLLGNAAAIAAAVAMLRWPRLERWLLGVNVAVFAMPPIAIVPVLIIAFDAATERVLLAALAVYYPTMTAALLGLRLVDARAVDLVHAYAGGWWAVFRWVRLRASLPTLLAGVRVAAPNAVLGAILGEFGSGMRWGLGSFLLGSLGHADPVRIWGIGLVATAMAGTAYVLLHAVATAATRGVLPATLPAARPAPPRAATRLARWLDAAVSLALPFAVWWGLVLVSGLPGIVARSPAAVADYLLLSAHAADAQAALGTAVAVTLPYALAGLTAGIAFAFLLAVTGVLAPGLVRSVMPVALVSQTMPLVALTPLIVLLLGRGTAALLTVTVSVTFFPAYVTIAQGLALVPSAAFDVVRSYGAGPLARLRLVAVPSARAHVLAAARLAAPRALLGVMIAEWLATGTGLGGLLNRSRGMLDYGMIWSVAFVAVAVATLFYAAVGLLEGYRGGWR